MREVDVEVVPPDGTPFVVQLLSTGELPGLTADPHLPDADRDTREQPRAEATDAGALAEPEHGEPDPEVEQIATSREPDPAPPEVAEAPSTAVPRRPPRKRRATTQRAHPPHRHGTTPRPASALQTEAPQQPAATAADATCEIRFWRGYLKANFYACVFDIHGEALAVAESPFFRARSDGLPDQTEEAVAAYDALRQRLEQLGWEHAASGRTWFGDLYRRPV